MYRSLPAKSFALDFDEQVEVTEEPYGPQLKLQFSKYEVSKELGCLKELYPQEILRRADGVLREQIRKYPVYF